MISLRQRVQGIFLCLVLASCGTAQVTVHQTLEPGTDLPKTVAILPFATAETVVADYPPHEILREVFFNYFSYLGYTDVPLDDIDRKLHDAGIWLSTASTEPDNAQLRDVLGVDAVIRGVILEANNVTAGIHAETSIRAKIEMVDLRNDTLLWEAEHTEIAYAGIASPTLVDIIQEQVENVKVQEAYYKSAEAFSIKVLKEVPDPAPMRAGDIRLPVIQSIETNIKAAQIFGKGDRVYVSLRGQPGLSASFDIGNWKTSIPMKEVSPGVYTGSYQVKKGDQVQNALIIGTLKNDKGLASKKFYKAAMASIDAGELERENPKP